jgi:hypothetical protein
LQLVLRFWWVGLLVIGGGIAAANWLGGVRPLTDIAVGECFDLENPDEIDDVTKRDCTDPHEYEMLLIGELPDGPFPSDAETDVWFDANCRPAFAEYVGLDYDSSELYMLYIVPTEETWNDGDHGANCAIYDQNNPELTESVKDSAR